MPRTVRVATVATERTLGGSVESNRKKVMELLDRACLEKPDVVCLPEGFPTAGVQADDKKALAEPVPGPTTEEAAKRAREHGTYVVCPLMRRDGDSVFNSSAFIDRKGEIAGIYDKMYLPNLRYGAHLDESKSLQFSATPGTEAPVFDLDFGRAGAQICFDADFDDGWKQLADRGAEMVFWSSAFDGGFRLRSRAFTYRYYIVSSVLTDHAYIIDPLGQVLKRSGRFGSVIAETINLDYVVCYFDYHKKQIEEMKEKYGNEVTIRVLQEEGYFILQSEREGVSAPDMAREFKIVPAREFFRRHEEQLSDMRKDRSGTADSLSS
jgi:beta-ureidopropionase